MTDFEARTAAQVAMATGHGWPTAADIEFAMAACVRINRRRAARGLVPFV